MAVAAKAEQIVWRLIDTGPLAGPDNMAVDEALLDCFDPDNSQPVLRLYGWTPPAFSLGRYQKAAEVLDLERCKALGVPVVRRITGGGVIYHADELTYSIVCAARHIPRARTVKESFERLCGFLLLTYRKLGLKAAFAVERCSAGVKLGERAAFCFAGKEEYDIVVAGRKVGGNAQRRLKEVIFQHGSIPLRTSVAAAVGFLREMPPGLDQNAASLADLGVEVTAEELKGVVTASFRESLGVGMVPDALTGEESETAEALRTGKYLQSGWNISGGGG